MSDSAVDDDVRRWLTAATADVERRGLPEVVPVLEGLALATEALRRADWNDRADVAPAPSSDPAV